MKSVYALSRTRSHLQKLRDTFSRQTTSMDSKSFAFPSLKVPREVSKSLSQMGLPTAGSFFLLSEAILQGQYSHSNHRYNSPERIPRIVLREIRPSLKR